MRRVSVNEWSNLVRKAAVGAGFDHGHGREMANASVWLFACGWDAGLLVRKAIENWADGLTGSLTCSRINDHLVMENKQGCVSGVFAAPAAADALRVAHQSRSTLTIEVRQTDTAPLIFAQLSEANAVPGFSIRANSQSGCALWAADREESKLRVHGLTDIDVERCAASDLRISTDRQEFNNLTFQEVDPDYPALFENGISLDGRSYETIKTYADRVLVPDSTQSRTAGAGAGLIDKD